MFEDQSVIESKNDSKYDSNEKIRKSSSSNKIIIFTVVIIVALIAVLALALLNNKGGNNNLVTMPIVDTPEEPVQPVLPDFSPDDPISNESDNIPSFEEAIEKMSFSEFYKPQANEFEAGFDDYELPLNVKIDVMNYYDISRKLDLDSGIDDLNSYGFTTVNNPWHEDAPDFYAVYSKLDEKQMPILITSDFLIYYYQNNLKKAFKDIEGNIFYENLWEINKELFALAKTRYESRLAKLGKVNDPILEGERLEVAFFAVALELLKPMTNQVASKSNPDEKLFDSSEVNKYYFVVPPYLREDVLREVELIRQARDILKSPVLLYANDYAGFNVPNEYRSNPKLNNFYLTTKWLNSVFPLNYVSESCEGCLLDKEDWRVNITASSLITHDFSSSVELRNKWARIYKIISYFKGLREDLNYVHYRDSLIELFGEDYDIEKLFADDNEEAWSNLESLRSKLLGYEFASIQGAWNKKDVNDEVNIGFRTLVDYYWPNDYIFDRLIYPEVDKYQKEKLVPTNTTACSIKNVKRRCNGFALDIINLVYPVSSNDYFIENTSYDNYNNQSRDIKSQLELSNVWNTTNYWSTLGLIKKTLEIDRSKLPVFTQSSAWVNKSLYTTVSTWVNLQLPLEEWTVNKYFQGQSLNDFSVWNENSYIEPNLELINELIASNEMLLSMLKVLRVDAEVNSATLGLQAATDNLTSLRDIVIKELEGEELSTEDNEIIISFVKQFKVESPNKRDKELSLKSPKQKTSLKEDLSRLKLLVLTHREDGNNIFSVGPVWHYIESN